MKYHVQRHIGFEKELDTDVGRSSIVSSVIDFSGH